jgi:hypothetical protein
LHISEIRKWAALPFLYMTGIIATETHIRRYREEVRTDMTESRLIYEIMHELGKHGYIVRCNAGHIKLDSGKVFHGMPRGFSDLLFVRDGRVTFIECKTEKGKATPEQEQFLERMRALGCSAGVARSVAEAMALCGIQ